VTFEHGCARCESPLEHGDLRCAVCGLPTPPEEAAERPDDTIARIFRCQGCGAAIAYDERVGAPRCSFCRTVMQLEEPIDPIEQAEAYLRFRVDEEHAHAALRRWMGSLGWLRPRDLRHRAVLSELRPLWWAGWTFDADVKVHWAADSDRGAGRSAWAPHAGARSLVLQRVVVSASRGLTDREVAALARSYRLDDASAEPEERNGATVEQFAVQRSAARRTVASALQRMAADEVYEDVPGSRVRNLHVAVLPERLRTRRLGFPAWVLAYHYRDRVYRAIVHGQDAECVHGEAPLAIGTIAAAVVMGLVIIAAIVAALHYA
jgi:hypothetical protein